MLWVYYPQRPVTTYIGQRLVFLIRLTQMALLDTKTTTFFRRPLSEEYSKAPQHLMHNALLSFHDQRSFRIAGQQA